MGISLFCVNRQYSPLSKRVKQRWLCMRIHHQFRTEFRNVGPIYTRDKSGYWGGVDDSPTIWLPGATVPCYILPILDTVACNGKSIITRGGRMHGNPVRGLGREQAPALPFGICEAINCQFFLCRKIHCFLLDISAQKLAQRCWKNITSGFFLRGLKFFTGWSNNFRHWGETEGQRIKHPFVAWRVKDRCWC